MTWSHSYFTLSAVQAPEIKIIANNISTLKPYNVLYTTVGIGMPVYLTCYSKANYNTVLWSNVPPVSSEVRLPSPCTDFSYRSSSRPSAPVIQSQLTVSFITWMKSDSTAAAKHCQSITHKLLIFTVTITRTVCAARRSKQVGSEAAWV